jgi:SNF family Na+-dependent transporter
MYLLNLVDASVSGFPLLVIGIFECVAISWIYGISNFSDDIYMMLGVRPNIFWKVCWMFVAPGVFLVRHLTTEHLKPSLMLIDLQWS